MKTINLKTPKGEVIADSIVTALDLERRPIGSLSARERRIVTRKWRQRNQEARRRIELADRDRLYPVSVCPVHRFRYAVVTGNRAHDCLFCRTARENAEAAIDMGEPPVVQVSPSLELQMRRRDCDAAWKRFLQGWAGLCFLVLLSVIWMLAENRAMEMHQARQDQQEAGTR